MFSKAPLKTVPQNKTSAQNSEKKSTPQKQFLLKGGKKPQEEEKKEDKKQGYTKVPSSKYSSIKVADPFSNKNTSNKSNSFSYVYNAGGIPCRVSHGGCKLYLQWNKDVILSDLQYDPILITCFEGLTEEKHPYNFIATQASKEMLQDENSGEQIVPILSKLVWPLRTALTHKNDSVFESALEISKHLSNSVGPNLNPHVKNLLVPIVKKVNNKKYRDNIFEFLHLLEENGGSDVLKIIKSSIPTYTSV